MAAPLVRCRCGEAIVIPAGDAVRIRGAAVVIKSFTSYVVCKKCKREVPVALRYGATQSDPPLVVPRDR